MTDTIDVAALVERLRSHEGIGAALAHDKGQTSRFVTAIMAEAATALQSQADALAEARRDLNKYAYERDKAREERNAAERRSEAFWPHTNIRRFRSDEEFEAYATRKRREEASLVASVRAAANA